MATKSLRIAAVLSAIACLFSFSPALASAQSPSDPGSLSERRWEEVVVVGSYVPRPAREVGSAVTVFSEDDIQLRQVNLGSELLREVPGIAVNRSGQVGALTQVRIRGAEGNHTLVMIDGIEANDPASAAEYDFSDLLTWDLGRVEVLRGPQSALYGSEAIGGVINIVTRTPEPGFHAHGALEAGSFGTVQAGASVSGASERISGLLSATRYKTDGISQSAIDPEKDGYENTTLHGKLEVDLTDVLRARLVLRHVDDEQENDRQDFDFPPTPTQGLVIDADHVTEGEQLYGLAELNARLMEGAWLHRLAYGYTDSEYDNYEDGLLSTATRGQRRKVEYETTFRFGSGRLNHALTGAVQREELKFENFSVSTPEANQSQDDDQTSFVAEYALSDGEAASVSLSVRHDDNDRFEDATTFRVTGSYLFEATQTRVHASYGEGITNPSFFELFGFLPDSFVGNPDLEPEKSDSWDIGVEQSLFDGAALIDVTYFDAVLRDEIVTTFDPTDFTTTAINQKGDSDRQGVELTAQAQLGSAWLVRATYTYLDATDPSGLVEIRRPKHSGSVNANYSFLGGRGNVNLSVLFNGKQQDSEFIDATPQTRVSLDAYTLVNLALTFDLTNQVQLFARGDNLLDEEYTEIFGYRSPGAAGYVGVRARL